MDQKWYKKDTYNIAQNKSIRELEYVDNNYKVNLE